MEQRGAVISDCEQQDELLIILKSELSCDSSFLGSCVAADVSLTGSPGGPAGPGEPGRPGEPFNGDKGGS